MRNEITATAGQVTQNEIPRMRSQRIRRKSWRTVLTKVTSELPVERDHCPVPFA